MKLFITSCLVVLLLFCDVFFLYDLNLFLPVMNFVVCSLVCLCSYKVAYIAKNMDPDQTAPLRAV